MAQKVSIELVDDIDGSAAAETVKFGLDGNTYEIDLNKKNADKLRKALDPYLGAGRKIAGSKPRTKRTQVENTREIRDWARSQGFDVPARGRIPNEIRDAFLAAQ